MAQLRTIRFLEACVSSSVEKPRVRLVAKRTEVEIPVAKEPPVPEIKKHKEEWNVSAPSCRVSKKNLAKVDAQPKPSIKLAPELSPSATAKAAKEKKVKPLTPKQQKRLAFKERYERAQELSAQYRGLPVDAAQQVLLGVYTVEDWFANRKLKREKAKAVFERRKVVMAARRAVSQETIEWQILQGFLENQDWLFVESGQLGLVTRKLVSQNIYKFYLKDDTGVIHKAKKLTVASIGPAENSADFEVMRERLSEDQLFELDRSPENRWQFPHEIFDGGVGRKARVTLVNNSVWSGFLAWNSPYSFGLSKEPNAENTSIVIFKHACCEAELV